MERQACEQTDRLNDRQVNEKTDGQTSEKKDQMDRRADIQTDKSLTQFTGGWVFFLAMKFAISLLALLAGG